MIRVQKNSPCFFQHLADSLTRFGGFRKIWQLSLGIITDTFYLLHLAQEQAPPTSKFQWHSPSIVPLRRNHDNLKCTSWSEDKARHQDVSGLYASSLLRGPSSTEFGHWPSLLRNLFSAALVISSRPAMVSLTDFFYQSLFCWDFFSDLSILFESDNHSYMLHRLQRHQSDVGQALGGILEF